MQVSVILPVLEMEKLKHREFNDFPNATQQISDRAEMQSCQPLINFCFNATKISFTCSTEQ